MQKQNLHTSKLELLVSGLSLKSWTPIANTYQVTNMPCANDSRFGQEHKNKTERTES
jgi:hypothetical protein